MNKLKILFPIIFVCLTGLTNICAQTQNQPLQAEPNYDVILHVLTGSNNPIDKSLLPSSLSNAVKKLKTIYSYSNYSLNSTYLERVTSPGILELKDVSKKSDQSQEYSTSVFTDWTLNSLRSLPDSQRKKSIQIETFRFGQRVPVVTYVSTNSNGKMNNTINYEQVGLTLKSLSLLENIPTIIGSLSTSKPDELIFLILTVKPADQ